MKIHNNKNHKNMLKQHKINFKGKDYLLSFPNVGELMEIESFKLTYTKGKYVQLSSSNLKNHLFLLDSADAVSYLSVLIPTLKEDLKVESWWKLDPFLVKELVGLYKDQFIPWYFPILKDLYAYDSDEPEGDKE